MHENILSVLGIAHKEDVVTNLLAFSIQKSVIFRRLFLTQVCGASPDTATSICDVKTRANSGAGIPDMVISLKRGDSAADLIILENKLKADEGFEQTKRYEDESCVGNLKSRFLPSQKEINTRFIYLTLFDVGPSEGSRFVHKRYSDLLPILGKLPYGENETVDMLLGDLRDLLTEFYSYEDVAPTDRLLDKLGSDSVLDGPYLYFVNLFSSFDPPEGLSFDWPFRSSEQGRHYYGAVFSKDEWHLSELSEKQHGKCPMDPLRDIHVHFEPQYNILGKSFSIYLHYEINPYQTEHWAQHHLVGTDYQAYRLVRSYVAKRIAATGIPNYEPGGGSNQIGKALIPLTPETRVSEFITSFKLFLKDTSQVVDKALTTVRSQKFSIAEMIGVIDELAPKYANAGYGCEMQKNADEYGFSLINRKNHNEYILWVGIWANYWCQFDRPVAIAIAEKEAGWSKKSYDVFQKRHSSSLNDCDGYVAKGFSANHGKEKLAEAVAKTIDHHLSTLSS